MKYYAALFALGFLACVSCTKDDKEEAVHLKVSANSTLIYSLGYFSDADRIEFMAQAENAKQSVIEIDSKTGEAFYYYQPQKNFNGCNYIEIATQKHSGPQNKSEKPKIFQLSIKVRAGD